MGCKFDKKRVVLTCSTKKLPYLWVIVHLPPPLTLLPLPHVPFSGAELIIASGADLLPLGTVIDRCG
jgi:hypothetical protein